MCFPVCPTCRLHSCTRKGQGCWRNALYFGLPTCKRSQTQRQTTQLRGKYGSCLFYVVVAVLPSDIFFSPSLVTLGAASKLNYSTMGAKCGGCFQLLWLFLLIFFADELDGSLCVGSSAFIWERRCFVCVFVFVSCYLQDLVSCSSFTELKQNINITLLLLYKLCNYCNNLLK